jgi:hypothetical protein
MNLFDTIKDAFGNEDEDVAQTAADRAATDSLAAQNQAAVDAASASIAAEADAQSKVEADARVAD